MDVVGVLLIFAALVAVAVVLGLRDRGVSTYHRTRRQMIKQQLGSRRQVDKAFQDAAQAMESVAAGQPWRF